MTIGSKNIDAYARQLASQSAVYVSPTGSGLMVSSGTIIKPTITYNDGGTVTIGATGTYRLFHTTNYFGEISEHIIAESILNIPDQITSYIVADYNSGNPQYSVTTDLSTVNFSNKIVVYTCSRVGDTNIDFLDWDEPSLGLSNKILRRDMECRRFERVTGLNLGEEVGRKVVISAGVVWQGSFRNSRIEVDSVANHCEQLNTDINGDWVGSVVTAYNNSQYNTETGLANLTDGNYAVNWVYRSMGINADNIIILLGTGDYDLNEAKTAQPPNNVPPTLSTNALLIGKIIALKNAVNSTQIDSVFQSLFAPSTTSSHEGLTSLEGGSATHHYHSDQPINITNDVEFNSIKSSTLIKDSTDNNKNAQFNTSAITSGVIRVYDLPNKNGTIAVGIDNVTNDAQVKRTEMGVAEGVATLNTSGKLNTSQIPDAILGGLNFQGTWNATTNTPTIPVASTLNKGHYYKVNVVGTTDIDGISDWTIGDWIVSNGIIWDKVDAYESVTSVAGKTGEVTLVKGDVGLSNVTNDTQIKKITTSVSGNIVTWDGTSGDTVEDSGKAVPSGNIVGTTDTQILSNKTLSAPIIGGVTKVERLALIGVEGLECFQTDNGPGKHCYTNGAWEQVSGKGRLYCRKTSNQTNVTTNTDITFQSATGNMTSSSPTITLLAGKTYRLSAILRATAASSLDITYEFVNSSNVPLPISTIGKRYTGTAFTTVNPMATAMITPTSDMTVKLRATYVNVTMTIQWEESFILVEQIL